jgi:hypothetical protein
VTHKEAPASFVLHAHGVSGNEKQFSGLWIASEVANGLEKYGRKEKHFACCEIQD